MTFEEMKKIVVDTLSCDEDKVTMEASLTEDLEADIEIITFPELSVTGYSCQDLFRQQMLLESSEQAVMMLLDFLFSAFFALL